MARLVLFAAAREAAGCREVDIPATSVGEVLDAAATRFGPEFVSVLRYCSILVDESTVPRNQAWEVAVEATTEIAVLPPVSGGQHHDGGETATGEKATLTVAVLTVSDASSTGKRPDESGPTVVEVVTGAGFHVVDTEVVPDERDQIEAALCRWADHPGTDLILTTGGTGLGPRDVTPEATRAVVDREVPGIPEAMRAAGMRITPYASLARQVAGQRGGSLIVNLPGSPKAARESLEAVIAVLHHAVALVRTPAQPTPRES
jgi:molybdopterin adenylyltransferase